MRRKPEYIKVKWWTWGCMPDSMAAIILILIALFVVGVPIYLLVKYGP